MQASEQDGSVTRRRSTRPHVPNVNRNEVLTLSETVQLRAQLVGSRSLVHPVGSDPELKPSQIPPFTPNTPHKRLGALQTGASQWLQCQRLLCLPTFLPTARGL